MVEAVRPIDLAMGRFLTMVLVVFIKNETGVVVDEVNNEL